MRQVVAYKGLKTMENHFKLSGPKSGPVAYRRWSFTRKFRCFGLAVVYRRWLLMEVRLH